ncbi:MAG: putative small integral membrane protein [Halieaceae bacterium]|jgi:predicted small integral membrane protein
MKSLRRMKILLVLMVALWGFVGALLNVTDWGRTLGAVGAATSMATFEGGAESWQATSNTAVIWMGALFILLSKLAAGLLCTLGGLKMWRARLEKSPQFSASKELALVGCAIAVAMLFGGFIVIAESWFELWRSDLMRDPVLESAFRYAAMIALIAIFVSSPED